MTRRPPATHQSATRRREHGSLIRAEAQLQSLEARCMLAADLVISEFLASNQTNITDNFGVHSDWIEIFNRGNSAATLNDYYLTDDAANPVKWRFPTQSLAAGAYLVVFASDRNLAAAGQPLHTNFKLSADGEYLGMMKTDGTAQYAYAPSFPAQTGNVSYGLSNETDSTSGVQFFGTPTPGAVNVASAAAPVFSSAGKVFSGSMQLTLSSTTPGAQIRYTTNRSEPTATSPLYTAPLTVISTMIVRARVFASGYNPSAIVGNSFVRVDAGIANVDTNLGMVIVDTHGAAMNDTTLILGTGAFINNADGRAGLLETPDYLGRIGIRVRGSTSQDFPKKQFAVELWDETNNDREAPLMGLPADSDWILYAPYSEKSLMQNALAYDFARESGQYAPRVKFVELYLNTSTNTFLSSSNYWGVYMLVEKIKISPDRVDITEISASDNTLPNISGGYLWKKDRIEADETALTTSRQEFVMVEPEVPSGTQQAWLTYYLNQFETALYGANFKDPVNGYAQYIDVNSWIDHWLLTEMAKQIDGFRLSTFYYKDRNGKVKMGPQWDFNLSFGNGFYNDGANAAGWYSDILGDGEYPYFRRLMQDPAFKQKMVDRWSKLRETTYSNASLAGKIDSYVGQLSDNNGNYPVGAFPSQVSNNPVVRNFKRWNQLGSYSWPNGFYDLQGRWIEDVKMMKGWLLGRAAWMDSQLLPSPTASVPSGFKSGSQNVTLNPNRVNNTDVTLISSTSPVQAIIPTSDMAGWTALNYNTSGWLTGTNGVGYDTTTSPINYNPLIGLNVSSMLNSRSSVFIRIPFNVTDISTIKSLVLKMKYEDGFVAFLNGHQVAFANEPGSGAWDSPTPFYRSWNSSAMGARDDSLAITFAEWDISAWKSLLVNGNNVLAIHGMNSSAGSSDLLILPELVSRTRVSPGTADTQVYYTLDGSDPLLADGVTRNPNAVLYTGSIGISVTARLKSRSIRAGVWSGLSENYYLFASDSLRVSELMYNPSVPAGGSFGAQEYEYIELQNTGSAALNLKDYAFVDGIDFTFPDFTLAPGAFVVVAKNLSAFQERYGTSVTPIGAYSGSLDNAGDTLELRDPFGAIAQQFTYDDAWYPSTDGSGASLEALAPGAQDLSFATSWRASADQQGTPGSADLVAPLVVASDYPFDTASNQIVLTFSESVAATLDLSDIVVTNLGTSQSVSPIAMSYNAATNIATFTFGAGVLIDGNYRAAFTGAGVTDAAGNVAGNATLDFFVLTGDVNRDRAVNFDDLLIVAQNYGQSGRTYSQGNLNYSADGLVDFDDLLLLAQRYGSSLAAVTSIPSSAASAKRRANTAAQLLR